MTESFALLAALAFAGPAVAAPDPSPEQRLAAHLRGRLAGEPVRCIPLRDTATTEIVDGAAILYRIGGTIWVNRPRGGAETLRSSDIPVVRTFDTQLCRPDVVQLVDRFTRVQRGLVSLGDFVPYRRAER